MIDYYDPEIDLTLLGCGFLGTYHIGAIALLRQIWPHKPYKRICGASCGGLLGALLVSGVDTQIVLLHALEILRQLRGIIKNPMGFRAIKVLVQQNLEALLPDNAHETCSGSLGLSLTKIWSLENVFVSEFKSRQELIEAIAAGCFIPFWSGSLTCTRFKGERYVDGAYSDNNPRFKLTKGEILDGRRQIDVCPFAGEVGVAPRDEGGYTICRIRIFGSNYNLSWQNIGRFLDAMIPMRIERYASYLFEGHRMMKDYVLLSGMVKCPACYQSHLTKKRSVIEAIDGASCSEKPRNFEKEKSCLDCLKLIEKVQSLQAPQELVKPFYD